MLLSFLTINAHKGFSALNKRFALPELRECVHSTGADIVFMQEVVGQNLHHAEKYLGWPLEPQHEYMTKKSGFRHAYGKNAVYTAGHHGNAILSRFPIICSEKVDISTNRVEKRGLLYAKIELPGGKPPLHCICVHLGLLAVSRRKQFTKLGKYITRVVPAGEPIIVAGDFNEWRKNKKNELETGQLMKDSGLELYGRKLRTFPSLMPVFPLDRIYVRGLKILKAEVLNKGPWRDVSDHAALFAETEYNRPVQPAATPPLQKA